MTSFLTRCVPAKHRLRPICFTMIWLCLLALPLHSSLQTDPEEGDTTNNFTYTVSGVEDETVLQNIKTRLALFDEARQNELPPAAITHFYHQGVDEIKKAVEPYGYFHAHITGTLSLEGHNQWQAHYQVRLGHRLHITHITAELRGPGAEDKAYQQFLTRHMPQTGEVFSNTRYESAKKTMLMYAYEHGYLNARWVEHSVHISQTQNTCVIILTVDTGPQFYFGQTQFEGGLLRDSLLKAYLNFKPGDTYNEQTLRAFQQDLSGSGYFDSVQVHTKKDKTDANQAVPINVKLIPTQRKHYQVGGGWGTDTGVRGIATLQINRLNDRGHKLLFRLSASETQQFLLSQYMIPGAHPATQQYSLTASFKHEDDDQSDSKLKSIGASFSQIWRAYHVITALNLQEGTSQLTNQPKYRTVMLVPSINIQWTHSAHASKHEEGYHANLILQGSSKDVLSDIDFAQAILRLKSLQPFTASGNQMLLLSANAGGTLSNAQERLPVDYQFYVGGSQSLRGFSYQSIGPGPNFFTGVVEARQRLKGDLYLAAFGEAGNAASSLSARLRKDAGLGLVYQSLIGSFQLSVARPIHENDHSLVVSFNMGPEL